MMAAKTSSDGTSFSFTFIKQEEHGSPNGNLQMVQYGLAGLVPVGFSSGVESTGFSGFGVSDIYK